MESYDVMRKDWGRLEARMNSTVNPVVKTACAKAWLSALIERSLIDKVEGILEIARDQAAVASSASASAATRYQCVVGQGARAREGPRQALRTQGRALRLLPVANRT